MKNDFLIMEDEEPQYIWDFIQSRQMVFHPTLSPEGQWDYSSFFQYKLDHSFSLILDRNLYSYLLQFCSTGELADQETRQRIGALMAWAAMNDVSFCAILAAEERASQSGTTSHANLELEQFDRIFEIYPSQLWLRVAENEIVSIPKLNGEHISEVTSLQDDYSSEYYDMLYASVLHILYLVKCIDLSPREKIISFFEWTYDNILLCQYAAVYAILLFTQQKGVKPPKHSGSKNFSDVLKGCKNQAWDLTYPSIQSVLLSSNDIQSEFLFATNDQQLKNIYINAHGPHGINGLLFAAFSKPDYKRITDYLIPRIEKRQAEQKDNQRFSRAYLSQLILREEALLQRICISEN